jgi:rhomboid protease GluP
MNALVFTVMYLNGGTELQNIFRFGAFTGNAVIKNHEYFRFITAAFVHFDVAHIVSNCLAIFVFGTRVEKYFSKPQFVLIYVFSAVIGNLTGLFAYSPDVVAAGASGGAFGLMGAALAVALAYRKKVGGLELQTIIIFILFGFTVAAFMPNIGTVAHVGGLLAGFAVAFLITRLDS